MWTCQKWDNIFMAGNYIENVLILPMVIIVTKNELYNLDFLAYKPVLDKYGGLVAIATKTYQ